jgi:hypothetical protein
MKTIFKPEDFIWCVKRDASVIGFTKELADFCNRIINDNCPHPGCCCVCGHSGKCPEDGTSIIQGIED